MVYILIYIIIGAFLTTIGLSLLTNAAEVISLLFEVWKAKIAVKIQTYNKQISDLAPSQQEDKSSIQAIGFTIPKEEDGYYD